MGELQTVTFLALVMVVILILFLSLSKNGQITLYNKSGTQSDNPRYFLHELDPSSPIIKEGYNKMKKEHYNENFTVKYERREQIQTPMLRQQTRQVVSSAGPAPPIPMDSYETVGIKCVHGNCDYKEIEPYVDQRTYGVKVSNRNPFMKI